MKKFIPWAGIVVILIIIFGTIYGVVQQSQRSEANYPQIQMAEDAARQLDSGTAPGSLTTNKVDISKSLMPFFVIYDKSGNVVEYSGFLNEKGPKAPVGILKAAEGKDFYAITWQPRDDVRIAAVTVSSRNYYVLAGRSLKEVEANENRSFLLAFAGGVLSLIVLTGTYLLIQRSKP